MYNGILIGKRIEVLSALDRSLIKKNGLVVDETKNLLILESPEGNFLKVPKLGIRLSLLGANDSRPQILDGAELAGTPDERIRGL